MTRVAEYVFPRRQATVWGVVLGIAAGLANSQLGLDFRLRPALVVQVVSAVLVTLVVHEGIHGAVGRLLGYRPIFGVKPPLAP